MAIKPNLVCMQAVRIRSGEYALVLEAPLAKIKQDAYRRIRRLGLVCDVLAILLWMRWEKPKTFVSLSKDANPDTTAVTL